MSHRLAFVARACGLLLVPGMVVAACSVQTADTSATTVINPAGGSAGSGGHSGHGGLSGSAGTVSPMGGVSGASAGSAGAAGSAMMQECTHPTQVSELISDFSSNYTGDLMAWGFGGAAAATDGGFFGGGYVYPAPPSPMAISADLSQGNFRVTGTVSTASGFGLWFASCSDAHGYQGIAFKIGGNVGDSKTLKFSIQINPDLPIDVANKKGACLVKTGTANYTPDCVAPSTLVAVSEMPTVVMVPFGDPNGGTPTPTVDPAQLLGIQFAFMASTLPYDVDVKLDDVRFYGGMDAGAAGAPN